MNARKILHDLSTPLSTATILVDSLLSAHEEAADVPHDAFPEQELLIIQRALAKVAVLRAQLMAEIAASGRGSSK